MNKKSGTEIKIDPATLKVLRQRIDAIDQQILELLKERLLCAQDIGRQKSLDSRAKWDPERERQIFDRLRQLNGGKFPERPLISIFREIITTCRLEQQQAQGSVDVGYLGPEGTFSNLAAVKRFGHLAHLLPLPTIDEIFHAVAHQRIRFGIVPVENSIEGSIALSLDSFKTYNVKILSEINLPITLNLVNYSGNLEDIKQVISHPQPLAQCQGWLRKHLPDTPTHPVDSTGAAADQAQKDHSLAAVASDLAIKTYDLQVVARGIEDYRDNITRFLVIGDNSPPRSGRDKTSLLLTLVDRPGALYHILNILAERNINLTKIESRPVKGEAGRYMFFIDLIGHLDDPEIKEACERLRETCASFKWLGSYPRVEENDV